METSKLEEQKTACSGWSQGCKQRESQETRLEKKVGVWAPGLERRAKVVGLQLYSTVAEESWVEAAAVGWWQEHFLGIRRPGYRLCLCHRVTSRKSFWGFVSLVKVPRSRASDRLCPWLLGECGKLPSQTVSQVKALASSTGARGVTLTQSSLGKGSGFAPRVSYHWPAGHRGWGGGTRSAHTAPQGAGDGHCSWEPWVLRQLWGVLRSRFLLLSHGPSMLTPLKVSWEPWTRNSGLGSCNGRDRTMWLHGFRLCQPTRAPS